MSGLPESVERVEPGIDLSNPYLRVLWENIMLGKLTRQYDVQALFCPGGLLPRFGLPVGISTVVTFQNMLPYDRVQRARYPWGARRVRDWLLERALSSSMRRANLVIFISRFAKDFIQHVKGPLRSRYRIIPHGIDAHFFANPDSPLQRSDYAPPGEYYLYVSYIDFYKSQVEVVRAFASLRARGVISGKLVFVGEGYAPYREALCAEIESLGVKESVVLSGNLPHDQLPAFYQHAHVNLFASRTENCPNILFEIMASGRPAVISSYGPMPEFALDTVEYFDPASVDSLVAAWGKVIKNMEKAEVRAWLSVNSVIGRTWKESADSTWQSIGNVVNSIDYSN